MTVSRLFPLATNVSGSNWTAFGASPAHVGLSDANDGTGVSRQVSSFEPNRNVEGTAMTQLPTSSGVVKQLTIGLRAGVDIANSCSTQARLLFSGAQIIGVNVPDVSDTITTYTNILAGPVPFAKLNALTWEITSQYFNHAGVVTSAYELWLDVEWYPVQAGGAFMIAD